MKPSLWAIIFSLSVSSAFALPAKFLAPDSSGRPQIQITETGQYYLFRSSDAYDGACDSKWYTTVVDSNNKYWCRTVAIYPQNAIIVDTLPLDAVSENSPAEFEYKVGTSSDINSAIYIGWAPRIAISDSDPVETWLQKINTQFGINISRGSIPDGISSSMGAKNSVSVTYGGSAHIWSVYYNNKYVALFSDNGALMGLTHRVYGMEFIDFSQHQISEATAFRINPGWQGSSSITPTINNGNLIFSWNNLNNSGYNVIVTWSLKSNSDTTSSSGLNGKISVTGTTPTNVLFPYAIGFSDGSTKQIMSPRQNGGKIYSNPLAVYGEYPSANWQAQFFSIQNDIYSLYFATEDAGQTPKEFHAFSTSVQSTGNTDFQIHPLDGATSVSPAYTINISPMVGSWEKVAKKYQYWASKQSWNSDGVSVLPKISNRPISTRVKQGAFWWTSFYAGGSDGRLRPTMFSNHATQQKNLIGPNSSGGNVRVGFHLYNWWESGSNTNINFDVNYPSYTPNQDTVAQPISWQQSINDVQSDGSLVAPYINASDTDVTNAPISIAGISTYGGNPRDATHCPQDTSGAGWWGKNYPLGSGSVNLNNSILFDSNNRPYSRCYGTRLHAFMDPSASDWQSVVNSNVNTVFNLNPGGIYLDVFGAALTDRDSYLSSSISGHPTGFGVWYRNGLRQIAAATTQTATTKEQVNSVFVGESGVRRFVAAEYFSEATTPYVDLVMNYESANSADLPVVQSIYNQYQMMVGQKPTQDLPDIVKKAVFGRSFVWGYQLGTTAISDICPNTDCTSTSTQDILSYLRILERARENIQQSSVGLDWNSARLVGLADSTTNIISSSGTSGWCSSTNPTNACPSAVRGALWSSTGTNAADFLVLTNTTSSAVTSSIPIPKAWSSASLIYQSASGPNNPVTPSSGAVSIYMPANSVAVYKATQSTVIANQYISVTQAAPASIAPGTSFNVGATASSGLPVAITAQGSCIISVSNSVTSAIMSSNPGACIVKYDQAGNSSYSAAPTVITTTEQQGLLGAYYNDINFIDLAFTRTDATINFNWSGSPGNAVGNDYFSVRWTGKIIAPSGGNYTFCIIGNDVADMYLNGNSMSVAHAISSDVNPKCSSAMTLNQGQSVPIRIDLKENTSTAKASLFWTYPGQTTPVIIPSSQLATQ